MAENVGKLRSVIVELRSALILMSVYSGAPKNGGDSCCVSPSGRLSAKTVSRGTARHLATAATVAALFSAYTAMWSPASYVICAAASGLNVLP